jgi:hypothetical protein
MKIGLLIFIVIIFLAVISAVKDVDTYSGWENCEPVYGGRTGGALDYECY